MKLADARELRDEIRVAHIHCVVPLGHGPDGYFARIWTDKGVRDFCSPAEWEAYCEEREKEEQKRRRLSRPKSAIERMIDKACGITEDRYAE